jgi:hypothetical protein
MIVYGFDHYGRANHSPFLLPVFTDYQQMLLHYQTQSLEAKFVSQILSQMKSRRTSPPLSFSFLPSVS